MEFPEKFESSNLSRDNLSREIGSRVSPTKNFQGLTFRGVSRRPHELRPSLICLAFEGTILVGIIGTYKATNKHEIVV